MRYSLSALIFATLTACAPSVPDDREISQDRALPGPSEEVEGGGLLELELCDAETYRPLVGSSVDETVFPVSQSLRVFGVNDIVTQDYIPQRTNVVYGVSRNILRVYCG